MNYKQILKFLEEGELCGEDPNYSMVGTQALKNTELFVTF